MGVPTNIGRFAVKEQSGGWGSPESAFANANFLECAMTIPAPTMESIQAEVMRADHFATTRVMNGVGPTEITLSMPLHGFSSSNPSSNPTEHPDALLLRSALGSSSLGGYHASDLAGGTSATVEVTDGAGTANDVGHAILVPPAAGTFHSVGWIDRLVAAGTPDDYELILPLANAPAASGAIYGSNVIALGPEQPTPFTLQYLGGAANLNYRFFDCVVTSATVSANAREQPTLEVTIRSANFIPAPTGGLPSPEVLANRPQMPSVLGMTGARAQFGAPVGAFTPGQLSISITAEVADQITYSTNGLSQFVVNKRIVELSQTVPVEASAGPTMPGSPIATPPGFQLGPMQIDFNNIPGRCVSVLIPAAQVKESAAIGDSNGLVATPMSVECAQYAGDSTDTRSDSTPANTAFRIAFL